MHRWAHLWAKRKGFIHGLSNSGQYYQQRFLPKPAIGFTDLKTILQRIIKLFCRQCQETF